MAVKYNFNMTEADIDAGIVSVGQRTAKLREHTHQICVSILARWAEMGDASVAARKATALVKAVDGKVKQSVVNWFEAFAGFVWDADDGFSYTVTKMDVEGVKLAKAKPFYQFTPDTPPQSYNLVAKLHKLVNEAKKRRENPKDGVTDEIPADLLRKLEALDPTA